MTELQQLIMLRTSPLLKSILISINRFSNEVNKPQHQPQPHLKLLLNKIPNYQSNHKLNLLKQYQQQQKLQQYFSQKTIQQFTLEDVYFYLSNKQKFKNAPRYVYMTMLKELALDCYSCFVIGKQMGLVSDKQFQFKLIQSLNEQCMDISNKQFVYCLQNVCQFQKNIIKENVNFTIFKIKLQKKQQQTVDYQYLSMIYLLNKIMSIKNLINDEILIKNLHLLNEKSSTTYCSIKHLYYLDTLQWQLNVQHTKAQQQARQLLIQRRISSAKTQQELQFSIKFLQYYNQFTYLIKLYVLNGSLYVKYLQYMLKQKKQNKNFEVIKHAIPIHVIQTSTQQQFYSIINLRISAGLDNGLDVGKDVKKIIGLNLKAVYGILKFVAQNCKQQNKIWSDFQQGFIWKLQLNSKYRDISKICSTYKLSYLFKIIAYVNVLKQGSVNFWRHCYHFVHDVLMEDKIIKTVPANEQNLFIINIFQMYQTRTIPQHLEERIINICLITLANNFWSIRELHQLTKTLTINKLGEDKIWYAIQNKILAQHIRGNMINQHYKIPLAMIFQNFKQMNVGSYKFYQKIKNLGLSSYETLINQEKVLNGH